MHLLGLYSIVIVATEKKAKKNKKRLCPWQIQVFPSTSAVLLLHLTWNQV